MSNAEALALPAPIETRALLRHVSLLPCLNKSNSLQIMEVKMELIPKEIEAILPPLYSQENVTDPIAVLKLFDPCGRYTLFVLEARREPDGDLLLFGFCVSPLSPDCGELGYVTLRQLESVRGPLGLGIERDLYFRPTPLSKIRGKS